MTLSGPTAVNHEAGELGSVVSLAASFPGEPEDRMRTLIRRYIEETTIAEWPMMARHSAKTNVTPLALAEAMQLTLTLTPQTRGQEVAQRQIATALENALEARRQRIIISQSQVNPVKWSCMAVQAICTLIAIAMVHSDSRRTSAIAMGLFATGVAVSVLLIVSHNRPFTGDISVGPGPLLQVEPETLARAKGRPALPCCSDKRVTQDLRNAVEHFGRGAQWRRQADRVADRRIGTARPDAG